MITVKALIENTAFQPDVHSEHGISFYIHSEKEPVIFDTGQTGAFIDNAQYFGTPLDSIDKVVISHGHYDHTGGLQNFLNHNPKAKVFLKKETLVPKFSHSYGETRQLNLPLIETFNAFKDNFVFLSENTWITETIMAVTDIKTLVKFENDDVHLTWENNGVVEKDPFLDELFLILIDGDSMNIITGCAHRGIINSILTAQKLFPDKKINHVMGGFHLRNKSTERVELVIRELNKLNILQLGVCHCTGIDEYAKLKHEFHGKTRYISTGILQKLD